MSEEVSRKGRYRRCVEEASKLTPEEARMAAAQNLRATHDVDDRVKSVDAKVASVGGEVKEVNDKVAVLIDGMQTHSSRPPNSSTPDSLEVREARVIIQQTANDADRVERS
jgi:hypothetical protein